MRYGIHAFILSCILLAVTPPSLQAKSTLFSPFPEAKLKKSYQRHYDQFTIITSKNKQQYKTKIVAGQISRSYYEIPKLYSEENILNNYLKSIKEAGGQVIFTCKMEVECGKAKLLQKTIRPLVTISDKNPHLVVAKFIQSGKETYLSIYVHSRSKLNNLQVDIIHVIEEPLELVKIHRKYLNSAPKKLKFKPLTINRDHKNASDHPLINRMPGSIIRKYKNFGYEQNLMVTGVNKNSYETVEVKGKTTMIGYDLPREYSEFEVYENYKAALNRAGFRVIFSCKNKKCGKSRQLAIAVNAISSINSDKKQHYLIAKLERPKGDLWASVLITGYINGLNTNLHIVEEKSLINNRLSVDADSISNAIEQSGHIALEGLLFKYDSDSLLAESLPVLKQIADYIKSVPDKSFYVVGHTDDKGKRSYNTVLSKKRAESIISLLVKNYSVNGTQLSFEGAGEYVPIANNAREDGRQLNRRVELVLRSDNL